MINRLLTKTTRGRTAWILLSIMSMELVCPAFSWALSSGPVQPETQGFEPVGTTDMVDLFTGDFVYNIPLLDVEGYPVNISYHGGVTMEQEASWVGLGWNITPGCVNHAIRGLPDEFDGDTIEKEVNLKPEITKKVGLSVGAELFGAGDPLISIDASLGGYLNISNYKGVSVDFTTSAGINTSFKMVSAGLNVGASVGSQSGASINYGLMAGVGISQDMSRDLNGTFNLNQTGVYSPRTGLRRDKGFDVKLSVLQNSSSTGTSVPMGVQNYTAAITNPFYMNAYSGQLKLGGEIFGIYGNIKVMGSVSTIRYDRDGSRKGFGYFHLDNGGEEDLLDFSREKDGMFNESMDLLPQSHLTYDIYSVSGQGTGGSFRPFRNDIGSVFDPATKSSQQSESGGAEAGLGNLFSAGAEFTESKTELASGPWADYYRKFSKPGAGGEYYEDVYFKEAGELTENNEAYMNGCGNAALAKPEDVRNTGLLKPNATQRVTRANHIFTHTGAEGDKAALVDSKDIVSYTDTTGFSNYPVVGKTIIPRVDPSGNGKKLKRKTAQLTEIVQNQKDGRRYVYGLPVLSNVEKEVTFAVDTNDNKLDKTNNQVTYNEGKDDTRDNDKGLNHYFSSSVTPSYVTAHLLTSVLSADYVDVTGNGISDDDLGTYTKFNYTRKSADYRWRMPVQSGKAQYSPGYCSDRQDDKATYSIGSREQWMLHSIETRNYVAEFYVSARKDALGVTDRILRGNVYNEAPYNAPGSLDNNKSYKLDSIVLYNKHDRFMNGVKAQAIKTVYFNYDYSLCKGVPNFEGPATDTGKLTLKKIQVKYGNSNLNMSAAYAFHYDGLNPAYAGSAKDRWGFYKPSNPQFSNFEFPFTEQTGNTDNYASVWSLTQVDLPSGGIIKVDYESDDYAYVQDKEAMEMFRITGISNSRTFDNGNDLYFSPGQPNLYFFFERRTAAENSQLSVRENYLKGTNILCYNIPVELKSGVYEPVKGYAEVDDIGYCDDGTHGWIKVASRKLEGSSYNVNPVVFTALNLGRYSLPHILFPGADPESSDIQNVVSGLYYSIKELFSIYKNPLQSLMEQHKGQATNLDKAYMRLTSPGLKKKGGGQRVKAIRFFDNWAAMAGGNEATYGKTYDYTIDREDGKGTISSGVASYEPMIGGDELPQRLPAKYVVQSSNGFPPNDPVELYQELPLGESFFPAPVVGYSNVRVRSINIDKGRSSQTEDISGFYTARDYPIRTEHTTLDRQDAKAKFSLMDVTVEQTATQGFSITLNDMHGKPRNTEHWVLKPAGGAGAKELVNYQKYEYLTQAGQLSNTVPVFSYNAGQGQLQVVNKKMGVETDLTIDSRMRREETRMHQFSANLNGFLVWIVPIMIPLGYPFEYSNIVQFKCATLTKVTQQYGVLNKVISNNQGAITEVNNEVFDAQTGNVLVSSVNNQFGDRQYTVNYPAHWAYKELGPAYENHDLVSFFKQPLIIDSLGKYAAKFVNYNDAFSSHYDLPRTMPVARTIVDEQMPKFKIGDELLFWPNTPINPVKVWVMGYSADDDHCYLILAPREPYKLDNVWKLGATYVNTLFRVTRSGNRNRLGETIQSYTTQNRDNIFPYLHDSLDQLITLHAGEYDHQINQVFAANQASDSLNPFVTGKVGQYRPDLQLINLTKRAYTGGTMRNAGMFSSAAYWKTEQDKYPSYCANRNCDKIFDSFKATYLGGDSLRIFFKPNAMSCASKSHFKFLYTMGYTAPGHPTYYRSTPVDEISYSTMDSASFVVHNAPFLAGRWYDNALMYMWFVYDNGCCTSLHYITYPENAASGIPVYTSYTFSLNRVASYNPELFPVTSLDLPTYTQTGPYFDSTTMPLSPYNAGTPTTPIHLVSGKIMQGKVGHYPFTDNENWVNTQQITRYNWFGQELENKEEGIGYNSVVFGYNQQLPVCVAKNARSGEVLFDGFEDYNLLQAQPDQNAGYMKLLYSPFAAFLQNTAPVGVQYKKTLPVASGNIFNLSTEAAHSGDYSLQVANGPVQIPLDAAAAGMADAYSFKMAASKRYVVNLWLRPAAMSIYAPAPTGNNGNVSVSMDNGVGGTTSYSLTPASNIIEGWQQYTVVCTVPMGYGNFKLNLASGFFYDDIRIYPFDANSKAFVYHPVTRKVTATLDENNYGTFYEYDAEGNLVRTKRETERGILTISENRSSHHKAK